MSDVHLFRVNTSGRRSVRRLEISQKCPKKSIFWAETSRVRRNNTCLSLPRGADISPERQEAMGRKRRGPMRQEYCAGRTTHRGLAAKYLLHMGSFYRRGRFPKQEGVRYDPIFGSMVALFSNGRNKNYLGVREVHT